VHHRDRGDGYLLRPPFIVTMLLSDPPAVRDSAGTPTLSWLVERCVDETALSPDDERHIVTWAQSQKDSAGVRALLTAGLRHHGVRDLLGCVAPLAVYDAAFLSVFRTSLRRAGTLGSFAWRPAARMRGLSRPYVDALLLAADTFAGQAQAHDAQSAALHDRLALWGDLAYAGQVLPAPVEAILRATVLEPFSGPPSLLRVRTPNAFASGDGGAADIYHGAVRAFLMMPSVAESDLVTAALRCRQFLARNPTDTLTAVLAHPRLGDGGRRTLATRCHAPTVARVLARDPRTHANRHCRAALAAADDPVVLGLLCEHAADPAEFDPLWDRLVARDATHALRCLDDPRVVFPHLTRVHLVPLFEHRAGLVPARALAAIGRAAGVADGSMRPAWTAASA
jgi:hypothetical protein